MAKNGPSEKLTIVASPAAQPMQPLTGNSRPPLSDQGIRKMQAKEVVASVRGFASNWSKEAEAALAVPGELNFMRNDVGGAVMFSKEKEFGIAGVVRSLEAGMREKPPTEYGIIVYEKASTAYLVLVDMSRRIVVRAQVTDYNSRPPQKEWADVVRAVESAVEASKAHPERVAVYDGTVSYV